MVSISAQGFTAEAESHPDGSLTLSLRNSEGHTIAVGRWLPDVPAETPTLRPADAWPARGAA